jgi:protein farnesyltransferase/geranylgeranyltransferase type-1 subunit alpha
MLKFGPRGNVDGGMPESESATGRFLDVVDEDLVDAEIKYVCEKILLAPQNRSPWAYARGVLRVSGRGLGELKEFAEGFVTNPDRIEGEMGESMLGESKEGFVTDADRIEGEVDASTQVSVKSGHALEWLADVYAEEAQKAEDEKQVAAPTEPSSASKRDWKSEALKMLMLLKEKYDPIRKNYWDYRIRALGLEVS